MPLWSVHHPPKAYSAQDKRDFATAVTGYYTRVGLPKFYVVVNFQEVDAESLFVGGEPATDTVRIVIEHIARHSKDPESRKRIGESIQKVIAPFTVDRGLHTEFHVDETPQDLWMIDGLWPPPGGSDAEKLWVEQNRPIPYQLDQEPNPVSGH
ncbi:phenylpyruvate tautomerase PptA (4-oxalocrotonate tautomerase family) [Pseudonocardia sediminis]|uniref:Phenylpyruvate tautomerase PptA (4-oxalocrotonate tautomerase family) n=1 Tax=Pseudonocardia sediminis TaxID=1397368 RepID=A0A4Q7UZH0_PSEST|nr:tautomerase family protein [Pseudonocardia sediminis]RZT85683.1 phenylpyruvate tautomerase PptA (4-oxalocrotonate tautomerase family) [Pseudonocardia sediminis]